MWYKAKYVKLRSKKKADEFFKYYKEDTEIVYKNLDFPEELSGEIVKVEFSVGKKENKILVVSQKDWEKFYKIHHSSVAMKYFYARSFEDIE